MRLQFAISDPVYRAGKPNAGISSGLQALDILSAYGASPTMSSGISFGLFRKLHHDVRVVFRFKPAHVQK
jgi:hypothetical protein